MQSNDQGHPPVSIKAAIIKIIASSDPKSIVPAYPLNPSAFSSSTATSTAKWNSTEGRETESIGEPLGENSPPPRPLSRKYLILLATLHGDSNPGLRRERAISLGSTGWQRGGVGCVHRPCDSKCH